MPAFRSTLAKKGPASATAPTTAKGAPPPAPTGKTAAPGPRAPLKPEPAPVQPAAGAAANPTNPAPPASATPPAPAPAVAKAAAVEAGAAKPLTDAERKKLETARQLLGAQRPSKELRQAFELARSVADAHPDSKEAQHLAAEGAYRISRWSDATTYFHRGGDPGEDEPERLFYMAVSLYESGDPTSAAAALRRALPNLKRTSYVESYIHKILGQP